MVTSNAADKVQVFILVNNIIFVFNERLFFLIISFNILEIVHSIVWLQKRLRFLRYMVDWLVHRLVPEFIPKHLEPFEVVMIGLEGVVLIRQLSQSWSCVLRF